MRKSEYIREKIKEGLKDSYFADGEVAVKGGIGTGQKWVEKGTKTGQKLVESGLFSSQKFVAKQPKKGQKGTSRKATLSKNFVRECMFLDVKPYELQSWCVVELRNRRAHE